MFDKKQNTRWSDLFRYGNSSCAQALYLHVHRFEAFPSIICIGISRGQVIKVLGHKNVVICSKIVGK